MTVHREIQELRDRGEVREVGREKRGGRPSPVYEYDRDYAARIYVQMRRSQGITRVQLERWDMAGEVQVSRAWNYAAVEQESLDGRLDELVSGQRVAGIGISSAPGDRPEQLPGHLSERYGCAVQYLNAAQALAQREEKGATIYLARGELPQGCIRQQGALCDLGRLDRLSLPVVWEELDYTDHTMVEEMVARLVQTISCIAAPQAIELHAAFWSSKLTQRIRFNVHSKLQGEDPPLRFNPVDAMAAERAQRKAAWRVGDLAVGHPRGKSGGNQPVSRSHKD